MSCSLLDEVIDDPSKRQCLHTRRDVCLHFIEVVISHDRARPDALLLVLGKKVVEREAVDLPPIDRVAWFEDIRLAQEAAFEPVMLDLPEMGNDGCHGHQRRRRKRSVVSVLIGETGTLQMDGCALPIEPTAEHHSLIRIACGSLAVHRSAHPATLAYSVQAAPRLGGQ